MAFLIELWIPILLSAVLVFVVSFIIHMFLGYHKNDFKKLPDEEAVMDAMRGFNTPPGDYVVPFAGSPKDAGTPEFIEKTKKGPVALMTVMANEPFKMGDSLVMWFIYSVVVGICSAYIADRALGAGAHYLEVFRFVGAAAFLGYSLALLQNSIWYKRNWCATLKSVFDGFIYALVTAGAFGWLWPSV